MTSARGTWLLLVVTVWAAVPAAAQDSVSTDPKQGDLLPYFDPATQVTPFVVDLHTFQTAAGRRFQIAPLLKASRTDPNSANSYLSAQGISRTQHGDWPFAFAQYSYWNAPGYGVNPYYNLPPGQVGTSGRKGLQFAVGFADYAIDYAAGWNANNIITGVVSSDPQEPNRLYVARIVAATNGFDYFENRAQFGYGSVDSDGHVHFRADDYGVIGPNPLVGNNLFRVAGLRRQNGVVNSIDVFGGSDPNSTDWLLKYNGAVHNVPNGIPRQLGARPVLISANFRTEYVYENTPGAVVADQSHAIPYAGGDPNNVFIDHRGAVAFTHLTHCDPQAIGTAAILAKFGDSLTDSMLVWQVSPDGAVINPGAVELPHTLPWHIPATNESGVIGDGWWSATGTYPGFDHYHSQTAFRGGVSQVALGADQSGRVLAVGTVYDHSTLFDNYGLPYNSLVAARFDCGDPNTSNWSVVAFIDQTDDKGTAPGRPHLLLDDEWRGSPLYDANDIEIGQLAPWMALKGEPTDVGDIRKYGPSLSAPAMDAVGNVYFISALQIYNECAPPDPNTPWQVACQVGLVRAVYNPASFAYRCELVLKLADVFPGLNSGLPYTIDNLSIRDTDSVNSATLWSQNVMQATVNNVDRLSLTVDDPRALGGLVLLARITYDRDLDGRFGAPGGRLPDETYDVLLFLRGAVPQVCRGDANCDGTVNFDDINFFVAILAGTQQPCSFENADVNGDGKVNFDDINPFVAVLGAGGSCP